MKILVVYYSKTGNTKRIGEKIRQKLHAQKEEIVDLKNRDKKIIGFVVSGYDAIKKRLTKIKSEKDPKKFDLVIIGTPVWAGTMTPAIRTYITKNKNRFKKIAFFCTYDGSESKTFFDMREISKEPIAILGIKSKEINKKETIEKIDYFCNRVKRV